jgi:hypothetical protein
VAPAGLRRRLASKYEKVRICYEVGPTVFGLSRADYNVESRVHRGGAFADSQEIETLRRGQPGKPKRTTAVLEVRRYCGERSGPPQPWRCDLDWRDVGLTSVAHFPSSDLASSQCHKLSTPSPSGTEGSGEVGSDRRRSLSTMLRPALSSLNARTYQHFR